MNKVILKMCQKAQWLLLSSGLAYAGESPAPLQPYPPSYPAYVPPQAVQENAAYQTANTVNCTIDRFGNVRLTSEVMENQRLQVPVHQAVPNVK